MNRNLGLLLSGQLVSQIGDKFHMLAVAFLVLETTGSPAKMGIVLFCSAFPAMVLGIVAGAVLDRYDRKAIIVIADLIRGIIVALVGVLYLFDLLSFGILVAAQLLISVCTAFFDPAIPAMIPQIAKRERLARANSQAQMMSGIATIIGPALGGLTVAWAGYLPVFWINAASYLISAGCEALIRLPPGRNRDAAPDALPAQMAEGFRYILGAHSLMVILVMVGVIHFFVGALETVIPVLAADLDGGGAAVLGILQTAFGMGTVIGALWISFGKAGGQEVRDLFGGVAALGLLLLILAGFRLMGLAGLAAYPPLFFAMGGAILLAGTSFRALLQKSVPKEMLGRVFGIAASVGNVSIPLSALVTGFVMTVTPCPVILLTCGTALPLLSAAACLLYRNQPSGSGIPLRASRHP